MAICIRLLPATRWLLTLCLLLPAWTAEATAGNPGGEAQPWGLAATPDMPPPTEIGRSVLNEPILAYEFGNGLSVRAILAGIHGGYEWNTTEMAHALMVDLAEHPETVPSDVTLWIVPLVNPDGWSRARGPDGRANAAGVDLNRNFPAWWSADWPRQGCWDFRPISAGSAPASEPETLALMSFLLGQQVQAVVSYHSAGLGIFAGGQPAEPRSIDLAKHLADASGYPYPPLETGCSYTGQLIDWAAMHGMAAVDVELSTHYGLDLEQNLAALTAVLAWRDPSWTNGSP